MKKLIALLALLTCWCWNLNTEAGFRPAPLEIVDPVIKPLIMPHGPLTPFSTATYSTTDKSQS